MLWNELIARAVMKKASYIYISPNYAQSKKIIYGSIDALTGKSMIDYIPKELIASKNEQELTIKLINGSIIRCLGGDDPDKLRGITGDTMIFDEYAFMKPEAWEILRPILVQSQGTAIFCTTPNGTNHAYDLYESYRDRGGIYWTSIMDVSRTQAIDLKDLEEEKKDMPQAMFDQEFLCKFLDGADAVFKRPEQNIIEDELDYTDGKIRIGIDPAGHGNDYTALVVLHENTGHILETKTWRQTEWDVTADRIRAMWLEYGKPEIIMDTTGAGQALMDFMKNVPNIYPFVFTEKSREELLHHLQIKLETRDLSIPDNPSLISELKSFRYQIHGTRMRMEVPEGKHDDLVFALALSVWQWDKPKQTYRSRPKAGMNLAPDYYRL